MKYRYVSIEGNIGAGKTTLAELLAKEFGGRIILEQFRENPYLEKFYSDKESYALQLEMSFMLDRYQALNKILSEPHIFDHFVVSDYMFARSLLFAKINLKREEHQLLRHLFDVMDKKLPKPELIFYLHLDTANLLDNIKKRGRQYEQVITKPYLNRIERMYFEYFKQMQNQKIVIVNVKNTNWAKDVFVFQHLLELFDRDYKEGVNIVDLS